MGKFIDLTGQRFGRWIVLRRVPNIGNCHAWLCVCDCGTKKVVQGSSLLRGLSKSCGCLKIELLKRKHLENGADGHSTTRLYKIWCEMKQRCMNPNSLSFAHYGGRGVYVCDDWARDFAMFREWAMKNGYNEQLSIDRIDVDGPYSPENCRWVNNVVQCNNKTDNLIYEYQGEIHTVADWARIKRIRVHTLYSRLRLGWSIEKALESPVETKFRGK